MGTAWSTSLEHGVNDIEQDSRWELKECDELLISHRSEMGRSKGRLTKDMLLY